MGRSVSTQVQGIVALPNGQSAGKPTTQKLATGSHLNLNLLTPSIKPFSGCNGEYKISKNKKVVIESPYYGKTEPYPLNSVCTFTVSVRKHPFIMTTLKMLI
jgi:hypothetical protein